MNFHIKHKTRSPLFYLLVKFIIVLLLWTMYRIFFQLPEWFDEFIAKPILWISPLLFFQRNIVQKIVKSFKINISYNILLGLSIGILYFCLYTFFSLFTFGLPAINPSHLSLSGILIQLAIAISTGCIEEIVFRRYFLEEALLLFNDRTIANSFTTILFTLIHLPIILFVYKYSFAATISYLAILAVSGFIYGLVYLHKRSLLAASTTHAVWNFLGTMIR